MDIRDRILDAAKRVYEQPPPKNMNVGMTLVVAFVVACAVLVGAAQMLIIG
jgi:hypothetical protein